MAWDRSRDTRFAAGEGDAFASVLEHAPLMALLIDEQNRVVRANALAREFFRIDAGRLPESIVEATLESRLDEVVAHADSRAEVHLVHHRGTFQVHVSDGPGQGRRIVYLADVTELRRLATVRQEFVANLVHELKTPLTSLRLAAESLLGDPPPEDRRLFAQRLVREADLLTKIIDNLRQLGEIEAGAMSLIVSEFNLRELVADTAARLDLDRPLNQAVDDGLELCTDRAKLAQVIGNLLDNAAKFSPPGSAVDVTAERMDGELVISVRDRGPGISPEHWNRVFERFYKVDRARPREAGGFGLGLAITKHLVQVLGGRIWTWAARDGGQVFSIALPAQVLTAE